MKSNVNILFGGRKGFFLPAAETGSRKDGRNLIAEAKQNGYAVAETAAEMKAAPGDKILGLFNMGNMLFEIDRKGSSEPSLAEMAGKALEVLEKNQEGFFLMVEGGRIDHAAHNHDIAAVISDTLAFDEAVKVAYDYQRSHPDTLLIVTADHETGGVAVLPYGKTSKEFEGINLESIAKIKASHEVWGKELGKDPTPAKIKEVIKGAFDIELTDDEAKVIQENTLKKLDPRHFRSSIGFVLRLYHRVGWVNDSHTASPLFLLGVGPGAEKIKGWKHNTEVFTIMKEAFGF